MANKVKFGLSEVHIAPITYGENNAVTYGEVFAIPGAVSLTLDAEGESADFFADNVKYFNDQANNGYSGSLEMALITDEFRTKILGESQDQNGALIENGDDKMKDFALGFQIDGDETNTRYWYYQVSPSRPSTSSSTIENTKSPVTDTINISAGQRISDKQVRAKLTKSDTNTAIYNSFFAEVYEEV